MYRAGITTKDGKTFAENFSNKEEAELWILEKAEKIKIKKSIIVNKQNIKERYIETWE